MIVDLCQSLLVILQTCISTLAMDHSLANTYNSGIKTCIKKIHSTEIDALPGDVVLAISTGSKLKALISTMILLVWKSRIFSLRERLDLLLNFFMNIHFVLYIIR